MLFAFPPDTAPPPPPPAACCTEYAPYFYTWGWGNTAYPFVSLVDLRDKTGLGAVTLAFVLSGGGCAATREIHQHLRDVRAFRSAGGKLKASFGGASGTYLETACADSRSLAEALSAFVDQTGITDLDFDVEQAGAMNASVDQKRAEALKAVQDRKGVRISLTLASTPGGITAPGIEVIKSAVQAGVRLYRVNLMTMGWDARPGDGKTMSGLAISALTSAKAQLRTVIGGLSDAAAWAMLGATPMIGQNSGSGATFTLADARALVGFARAQRLGLLSFWAINRDQPGSGALGLHSRAQSSVFAFHQVFATVTR